MRGNNGFDRLPEVIPLNCNEDFKLDVKILDAQDRPALPTDVDFVVRLIAGSRIFTAGRRGGVLHNCRISGIDDSTVTVIADSHGLGPCRSLDVETIIFIPDPEMPDGIRTVSRRQPSGYALTLAESALPSKLQISLQLPIINAGVCEAITIEEIEKLLQDVNEM